MKSLQKFNNLLALLIAVVIFPGLWVGQGLGLLELPGEVLGATVSIETMIAMFYFRKKPPAETTEPPSTP